MLGVIANGVKQSRKDGKACEIATLRFSIGARNDRILRLWRGSGYDTS